MSDMTVRELKAYLAALPADCEDLPVLVEDQFQGKGFRPWFWQIGAPYRYLQTTTSPSPLKGSPASSPKSRWTRFAMIRSLDPKSSTSWRSACLSRKMTCGYH